MGITQKKINRQGLTFQAGLVDRIVTLRAPSNQKELLTFLSMIGFSRTHIKRFAVIAAPLYARLGTKLLFRFSLSESVIERFEDLILLCIPSAWLPPRQFWRILI
jgi:hypothetical protein